MVLFELHLSRSRPGKAHIFKNECFGQITFFNPSLTPKFQYKIHKILVIRVLHQLWGLVVHDGSKLALLSSEKIPKRLLGKNIGDDKWSANDGMTSSTIFLWSRFSLKNNQDFMVHVKLPSFFSRFSIMDPCLHALKRTAKARGRSPTWIPQKLRSTTRPVATGLGFFNCLVIAISGQMGWFTPRYHSYIWLVCIHISHINLSLSKRESLNHSIIRGDTSMNNNILHYVGETSGCIKTKKLTEITGIGKVSS